MRLYLSSYQLGSCGEVLAGLVGGNRRGWVVMNALDGLDDDRRRSDLRVQVSRLAALGLEADDLDLRAHDQDTIAEAFGRPDFVWVRGGNVFTLRMAMSGSGLDEILVDGLAADRFVYAGFSAGPCVLAPSLRGLELCDPLDVCRATYGAIRWDGLGVLDRPFVPHLRSPAHPETALLHQVADGYDEAGLPYWGLADGQVLVVDGPVTGVQGTPVTPAGGAAPGRGRNRPRSGARRGTRR